MDEGRSREEILRGALEAAVEFAERMAPYCKTTSELIEVARLGLTNPGQLRLLLKAVTTK